MAQILKPADLARRLAAGEAVETIFFDAGGGYRAKLAGPEASVTVVSEDDRTVDFCISTPSVDRYCDTLALGGWKTANWQRNPVVLWAHDDSMPAIGRGSQLRVEGRGLRSTVTFPAANVYAFSDTIFRLIQAKIISAASVGFIPLKFEQAKDKGRPLGLDIVEQELLEWSVVNIPANPDCLAQAKSLGIDMRPVAGWAERVLDRSDALLIDRREIEALSRGIRSAGLAPRPRSRAAELRQRAASADWKCGAARDLAIENDDSWDGPAAEKGIFEACGFDGDSPDAAKARKAFLAYDASAPTERGSYKLPFAKMVDGALKASAAGIRAAASRLPQADIPLAVKDEARKVLDHYEAKLKDDKGVRLKAAGTDAEAAALVGKRVQLDPTHALNAPGGHFVRHLADFAGAVGVISVSGFAAAGHRRGRHLVTVAFGDKVMQNLAPERLVSAGNASAPRRLTRGLGHVAWLAQLLCELGCLEDCVEWEAVSEGDGSPVPAQLHTALQALGQCLVDMTQEEVAELLSNDDDDGDGYGLLPMVLSLKSVQRVMEKAGRVLSSANEKCLRDAHDMIQEACGHIRSVVDQNADPDIDPDDDDTQKAIRLRRAQALKRKAALQAAE